MQKTAYELRISDWSSDVCSSDLARASAATATCLSRSARPNRFRRSVRRTTPGRCLSVMARWSRSRIQDKIWHPGVDDSIFMRILLVEDESELARWLTRSLARHGGFVADWADDAELAERRLATEEFDAIILDLGLPGLDWRAFLARLRARDDRTPVLVLTARDSLAERIDTLAEGADDLLRKPLVIEELEARQIGRASCRERV